APCGRPGVQYDEHRRAEIHGKVGDDACQCIHSAGGGAEDHHGAVPSGHGTTFTPVSLTETTELKHRRGRDLLRHVTATGGELGEVLGDRVRELIAHSSRIA